MKHAFVAQRGWGPVVTAPALVSPVSFSARYDLDRPSGTFSRAGHPLEGQKFQGTIFVVPAVQGGINAGWAFYDLKSRGLAPAGLVFTRTNPVMVQGAVFANIPIIDGLDEAAFSALRSGQILRLDPANLLLEVVEEQMSHETHDG